MWNNCHEVLLYEPRTGFNRSQKFGWIIYVDMWVVVDCTVGRIGFLRKEPRFCKTSKAHQLRFNLNNRFEELWIEDFFFNILFDSLAISCIFSLITLWYALHCIDSELLQLHQQHMEVESLSVEQQPKLISYRLCCPHKHSGCEKNKISCCEWFAANIDYYEIDKLNFRTIITTLVSFIREPRSKTLHTRVQLWEQ